MELISSVKKYFSETRNPRYSFIMVLPMLLTYEYEAYRLNNSDVYGVRNYADIYIKQFFSLLGIRGHLAVAFVILLFALIVYRREKDQQVRALYCMLMICESIMYALLLGPLICRLQFLLSAGLSQKARFVSCFGAGVYEEFLFRLLIFSGCHHLLLRMTHVTWFSAVFSALISSSLFSGFHYIGKYAENLELSSFLFRMSAGLLLCGLYYLRGFAVTAYTHTVYNLLLLYKINFWKVFIEYFR